MAMRLVDDPDQSGSGAHDGKLPFRLHDNAIDAVQEGADGEGGDGFPLAGIDRITVTGYVSQVNGRSLDNALADDFQLCLTRGVRVKTTRGEVAVESLRVGDRVFTLDHGYQPIRWIGSRAIAPETLRDAPRLRPVRIAAGALAPNMPTRELLVSPQHRIWISSRIARNLSGNKEVLVPARKLVGLPGIEEAMPAEGVTYFHLLFDRHEIIWSNGAATESLYTGPQALASLTRECRAELLELFPGLMSMESLPIPARPILQKKGMIASLVKRHLKHDKPLVTAGLGI